MTVSAASRRCREWWRSGDRRDCGVRPTRRARPRGPASDRHRCRCLDRLPAAHRDLGSRCRRCPRPSSSTPSSAADCWAAAVPASRRRASCARSLPARAARSSSPTAVKASRQVRRTPSCSRVRRTSCSTGSSSRHEPSARTARTSSCTRVSGHPVGLRAAMAERGHDPVAVTLEMVPRRYVASEESAHRHALNGGDAMPVFTPPRPFERGVDRRPTLISNVESLAHLATIARFGPEWFRELGDRRQPGTMLVTVSGAGTERPRVRRSRQVRRSAGSRSAARPVRSRTPTRSWSADTSAAGSRPMSRQGCR